MNDNVLEFMRRSQTPQEEIDRVIAEVGIEEDGEQEAANDFEVYAENWESVMFFLKVQTQWVYVTGGMSGAHRAGLNNTGIESTMNMAGVPRKRQSALLDDLQIMERAVLAFDSEQMAKRVN